MIHNEDRHNCSLSDITVTKSKRRRGLACSTRGMLRNTTEFWFDSSKESKYLQNLGGGGINAKTDLRRQGQRM
jgi:hypothetical protein